MSALPGPRACLSCSQNSSSLHIVNVTDDTGNVVYKWLKGGVIVGTGLTFDYINNVDCAGSTLVAQVGDDNGYVTIATMTIGSDYKIALVIADTYVNRIPDYNDDSTLNLDGQGVGAFYYGFRQNDLTSVVIGNAVTSIGNNAFSGNQSLVDITIGPSVGYIMNFALGGDCPGITSITIPDATTRVDAFAFNQQNAQSHNINTFHIGAGVSNVDFLKWWDNHVTTLTINSSNPYLILDQGVVYVKVDAFNVSADFFLYDKISVDIPATVTFNGVAIPVTSINWDGLTNVTSLTIHSANTTFASQDGIIYQKVDATNATISRVFGTVTNVNIPATIVIGDGAGIPVTSINWDAFTNLTSLTIDSANTTFALQDGIIYQKVDATNATISKVFGTVTNVNIPATIVIGGEASIPVTSIPDIIFSFRPSLTAVTIGSNVTSIGNFAFYTCGALTAVTIGTNVTSICNSAFEYCANLTSLNIPEGVVSIVSRAICGTGLTDITLPSTVTYIPVIQNCQNLTSITIGSGCTELPMNYFTGNPILNRLVVPASVTAVISNGQSIPNVIFLGDNIMTNGIDFFNNGQFTYSTTAVAYYVATKTGWSSFTSTNPPAGFSDIQLFVPEEGSGPSETTYEAGMNLSSGSLSVPNNGELGIVSGGTVSVVSGMVTILSTTGTFNVNLANGSANITTFNGSSRASLAVSAGKTLVVNTGTFVGTLSGAGTLEKTGSDTLTLSGNNSGFSGPIKIIEGTVEVTSATALGTGIVGLGSIYNDNTKLAINTTTPTTIINPIQAKNSGSNVIQNIGTGTVSLAGGLEKDGTPLTLLGKLYVNSDITGPSANSDLVLGDGSTSSADVTLYKDNTYDYNGPTTVNSGSKLTLQDGVSLTNSQVTINVGATLVLEYATLGFILKSLTMVSGSYLVVSGSLSADTYTMITCSTSSSLSENVNVSYTGSLDATVSLASNGNDIQIVIADNTPIPTSNVCFPAKTPVLTNCGYVNIEDINLAVHTIRNKKIVAITKTVAHDKNLVRIAKHALGHLYPEKTTFISQNHKVFFQGQMVKAKHLVDEARGVTLVPYNGEILYNVLLEQYEKMQVNNLIVETLHPEHKVAKLYRFLKNVDAVHHGKLIAAFNKCDSEQRLHR